MKIIYATFAIIAITILSIFTFKEDLIYYNYAKYTLKNDEYAAVEDTVAKVYVDICNCVSKSDILEKIMNGLYGNRPCKKRHSYEYYNAACMLALALYGGLRKGEITQIKTDTFDKEHIVGNLYKTQEKIKLRGDNKNHVYFIKQEVDRFVYLWKRQRKRMFRKYGHPGPELEQYLFINYHNGKWKRYDTASMSYFSEAITKVAKEYGIEKEFYWETARIFGLGKIKTAKLTEDEKKLMLQNYSIKEKTRYKKL